MLAVALAVVPVALVVVAVFASFGITGILAVLAFFAGQYLLAPFLLTIGAVPAERAGYMWLQEEVDRLALEASYTRRVRVYINSNPVPNAYAASNVLRRAIVVNRGLLAVLDRREVKAVLAHELGHIANRDSSYTLAAGFAPSIAYLVGLVALFAGLGLIAAAASASSRYTRPGSPESTASFLTGLAGLLVATLGLLIVLGTIIVNLSILAFSRLREHYADIYSAKLTRDITLISALEKIEQSIAHTKQHRGPKPPQPSEHAIHSPSTLRRSIQHAPLYRK